MIETQRVKYDTVAMALHWIIAILMIFMIFFGEDLMGEEGETAASIFLPSLHVSIGTSILLLSVLRLVWRAMNPPPALPAGMAPWEVAVTKVTHTIFYILMIGLPITGWFDLPSHFSRHPVYAKLSLFGLMPVPVAPSLGLPAGLVHNLGSKAGMVLVILHILAALKHQFINRDGLLRRMSPH